MFWVNMLCQLLIFCIFVYFLAIAGVIGYIIWEFFRKDK